MRATKQHYLYDASLFFVAYIYVNIQFLIIRILLNADTWVFLHIFQ
jgi:hypothetical protein